MIASGEKQLVRYEEEVYRMLGELGGGSAGRVPKGADGPLYGATFVVTSKNNDAI